MEILQNFNEQQLPEGLVVPGGQPLQVDQFVGSYYASQFQDLLRYASVPQEQRPPWCRFFPRAVHTPEPDRIDFLHTRAMNGFAVDVAATSTPVSPQNPIPPEELNAYCDALAQLFARLSEQPPLVPNAQKFLSELKLPDLADPEARQCYRLYDENGRKRLLVLWGIGNLATYQIHHSLENFRQQCVDLEVTGSPSFPTQGNGAASEQELQQEEQQKKKCKALLLWLLPLVLALLALLSLLASPNRTAPREKQQASEQKETPAKEKIKIAEADDNGSTSKIRGGSSLLDKLFSIKLFPFDIKFGRQKVTPLEGMGCRLQLTTPAGKPYQLAITAQLTDADIVPGSERLVSMQLQSADQQTFTPIDLKGMTATFDLSSLRQRTTLQVQGVLHYQYPNQPGEHARFNASIDYTPPQMTDAQVKLLD